MAKDFPLNGKAKSGSWYAMSQSETPGEVECYIYDAIGMFGISAKSFVDELARFKDTRTINLHINSPGGDVYDGLAIYNYLNRHAATIKVTIDGIAASMGSVIAMSGDEINIPENAFLMVHQPWSVVAGDSKDLDAASEVLSKIGDSIANIYATRTKMPVADVRALMDAETYLTGTEAVAKGFADKLEEPVEMYASFDVKGSRLPEKLKAILAKGQAMKDEPADKKDTPKADAGKDAPDVRADFKKFSDAFGAEAAGRYFAEGLTFEQAVAANTKESKAALDKANKELSDAKAAKKTGAAFDADHGDDKKPVVSATLVKSVLAKVGKATPERIKAVQDGIAASRQKAKDFNGEKENDNE